MSHICALTSYRSPDGQRFESADLRRAAVLGGIVFGAGVVSGSLVDGVPSSGLSSAWNPYTNITVAMNAQPMPLIQRW